jgi:hypothetical protein
MLPSVFEGMKKPQLWGLFPTGVLHKAARLPTKVKNLLYLTPGQNALDDYRGTFTYLN